MVLIANNCLYNTLSKKNNGFQNTYFGYLIIKKVNLHLGYYDINDKRNNFNHDLKLIQRKSDAIVFVGHYKSKVNNPFNNLSKLVIGNEIILKSMTEEKKYLIKDIKFEKNVGHIKITKKVTENILVLAIWNYKKTNYQLIIKAYLI